MKKLIQLIPIAAMLALPFLIAGCSGARGKEFADQPTPDLNRNTEPGVTRGVIGGKGKEGGGR